MNYGLADLQALAQQAGFTGASAQVAAAIAMAESGGDPQAVGDNGSSFGLWQVHTPAHPEYDQTCLFDPACSARAAYAISRQGTDFSPWSTYENGQYRQYVVPTAPASGTGSTAPAPSFSLASVPTWAKWVAAGIAALWLLD